MIRTAIGFVALFLLTFSAARGDFQFDHHLGHYGLGNTCAEITPLTTTSAKADMKFVLKCPSSKDTFEATVHIEAPTVLKTAPDEPGKPTTLVTPYALTISVVSFKSTYDTSSMVPNYTGKWKITTWVEDPAEAGNVCKNENTSGTWSTNSNTISGSAPALTCQVRSLGTTTAGFSFEGPGLFSASGIGFNYFISVRTFYTGTATPAGPPDIGHAPQRPDAASDTIFVNDMGKGKTLTCQPRSKGALQFEIDITRYLTITDLSGKLFDAPRLIQNQVVSDSATLKFAAYNAKIGGATGTQPELDLVQLNGSNITFNDKVTGAIDKTAGQWTVYSVKAPITQVKFPIKPGEAYDPPTPAANYVTINLDTLNSSDTYCMAVDWAQISFGAQSPLLLVHGTNADHTTWEFHIDRYKSPVDYLENIIGVDFEYKIDLEPNGSIQRNAELLGYAIERHAKRRGVKSVHLVTHSKGASDSRYFLSKIYKPGDYKVLSLYSLGTPSQGTILSDFSKEATRANLFGGNMTTDPNYSSDPMVMDLLSFFNDNIAVNGINSVFPGVAPMDPALGQQRVRPMRELNKTLTPAPGVAYYSLAGDADSNWNGTIDGNESDGFLPSKTPTALANILCNRTYQALGRVKFLEIDEKLKPVIREQYDPEFKGGKTVYYTVVRAMVDAKAEPNDLVSTVSSVHCQTPCGFTPLGNDSHADAVYPYHHSNLKSPELLLTIWNNITGRYKVSGY